MTRAILTFIALILAAVAALAWFGSDPGGGLFPLVGLVAFMLLLELPAVWWRMRGASPTTTWIAALACPLIIFGGLLGWSAYQWGDRGGDLQGFEGMAMLFFVTPAVLVSATVTATLASIFIKPDEEADTP